MTNAKSYTRIVILSLFWTAISAISMAVLPYLTLQDVLISASVDGITMAFCSWIMVNALNAYSPSVGSMTYISIWVVVLTAISWGIWSLVVPMPVTDNPVYNMVMLSGGLALPGIYFLLGLTTVTSNMQQRHQQQMNALRIQLKLNQEAGIKEMQHRFQPHFLYNTLNTINALIGSQPAKARETLITLSDLLRKSVAQAGAQLHGLDQELDLLQQYLNIEEQRFGDRLNVKMSIPEQMAPVLLPPFLLQPVLENAIKYGLYGTLDRVEIVVQVIQPDPKGITEIQVRNPFDAEAGVHQRRGTQSGLAILKKRLQLQFMRNDLLQTRIEQEGDVAYFLTRIFIPPTAPTSDPEPAEAL